MGMILDTNGRLSGTPSVDGTSRFGVCVVDTAGKSKCAVFAMIVAAAPAPVLEPVVEEPPPVKVASTVAITSVSCTLLRPDTQYDKESDYYITGTASGPVGANIALPGLGGYVKLGEYTNTSWGDRTSPFPVRGPGDPETTSWTASLYISGNFHSHIRAGVFAEEMLQAEDGRDVVCQ